MEQNATFCNIGEGGGHCGLRIADWRRRLKNVRICPQDCAEMCGYARKRLRLRVVYFLCGLFPGVVAFVAFRGFFKKATLNAAGSKG